MSNDADSVEFQRNNAMVHLCSLTPAQKRTCRI